MKDLNYSLKLLHDGFSLLTTKLNKQPNREWKKYQSTPPTREEFTTNFYLKNTEAVGIITGYDFLECIDIDLKIFSTKKEQEEFWVEYIKFLEDNIYDFYDKLVIYKTKNNGYHLLYKSKRVVGNKKLATLKGHDQAVIETRGIGGYVFVYENSINDKRYKDIDFISDEDRNIIWACSTSFNYIKKTIKKPKIKNRVNKNIGALQPYQDYNQKVKVWDIVSSDFIVVRNSRGKNIIKRHNATSPHSGYIYEDSGCMFLFSTGTIYPNEKLITPFEAYTWKNHNGDFTKANSELYKQGYGDRFIPEKPTIETAKLKLNNDSLKFPTEIFPKDMQDYLLKCQNTLHASLDYMGCTLLWNISVIIGNSFQIKVKNGWYEKAIIWIALVGKAGIGKTPSVNSALFPLKKINRKEVKKYIKEFDAFEKYEKLTKEEKTITVEVQKPSKKQFIVGDVTIEALVDLHNENQNSIGVHKDEMAGWFKDMNKYRGGSDVEHWLSSWSNEAIVLSRKTTNSGYVDNAYMPVLGGIQPSIFSLFTTEENKDNGFLDRILLSYPELNVNKYSEDEMSEDILDWYYNYIITFYEKVKKNIKYDEEKEIIPIKTTWSVGAKKEWIRIFNKITKQQNSDTENQYMKSMLPKQKSYIPRFALILNTFNSFADKKKNPLKISKESILAAEKLSDYFIEMAKKVKIDSKESKDINKIINKLDGQTTYDKFIEVYKASPIINKSKLAEILEVSKRSIYNYIKQYKNEN